MATYSELYALMNDATLRERLAVAVAVAGNEVIEAMGGGGALDNATARQWARYVIDRPADEARKALNLILIRNSTFTTAQITGVSDAQIQTQVDAVVPALIAARAAQ